MCPVPWASWTLWIAQIVMAVSASSAMIYLMISNWRHNRRWKRRDAELDAERIRAREMFEQALTQQADHPRADA